MTAPLPGSLLAAIIGISADAIICVDCEQKITFFNEGAVSIFGYSAEEVMGKPLDILLPERARAMHPHHIAGFMRSDVPARRMGERREIAGRRKNGDEFPAEAAIAKMDVAGQAYASVVLRDVTERNRVEARQRFLVEASDQLASLVALDETLDLLARLWIPTFADLTVIEMAYRGEFHHLRAARGRDGAATAAEPLIVGAGTGNAAMGVDAADAQRVASVPVAVALDTIPQAHRAAAEATEPTTAFIVSLTHRGDLLGRVTMFAKGRPALSPGDLGLAEDLARRVSVALDNARLHDQLQHALRARDDTMSVVSHDLRNPVNAVKMLAGALLQPSNERRVPEDLREQIGVIRSAAEQMDTLIQDLLDMSRAEAGRFAIDVQTGSAASLLRDALRTLAPLAAAKNVALVTDWPEHLPDVQVDPERIAQVVSNVVGNAIKFTPSGGTIRVSASAESDSVLVAVADTGPGIARDHLPHVFDRYWQSSRRNRGAGLGLPIAKTIVEAHGGRIWAESVEGQGTTLYFTLPRLTGGQ